MLNNTKKYCLINKLYKDQSGLVAIVMAILLPVLIGALALAIDVTYWRYRTAQLQVAADTTAFSLALDISNGIVVSTTLQANANKEAAKNGCTTQNNCTVTVTYPYQGDAGSVSVATVDTNATRLFSGFYDKSTKTLQGYAVAGTVSSGSGKTVGSACILALDPKGSYFGDTRGILIQGWSMAANTGCELVSNANTAQSIDVEGWADVEVMGSAVGQLYVVSGAVMPNNLRNPGISPMTDPYKASLAASGIANQSQFRYNGNGGYAGQQDQCIELIDWAGGMQTFDWTQSLASKMYNPSARGYQFSNVGGVYTHSMGGGGGRFCSTGSVNIPANVTLNLGSGIWYWPYGLNIAQGATVNATDQTKTLINAGVPNGAGQYINGVTFITSFGNAGLSSDGNLNIQAPSIGPSAGLAISSYSDDTTNQIYFFKLGQLQIGGAMYLPYKFLVFGNGIQVKAIAGPTGQASSGCMQIIADAMQFTYQVYLGNNCSNAGTQPFGTVVTTTGTGSAKAKLRQ